MQPPSSAALLLTDFFLTLEAFLLCKFIKRGKTKN
jgi:hypothetical protein